MKASSLFIPLVLVVLAAIYLFGCEGRRAGSPCASAGECRTSYCKDGLCTEFSNKGASASFFIGMVAGAVGGLVGYMVETHCLRPPRQATHKAKMLKSRR